LKEVSNFLTNDKVMTALQSLVFYGPIFHSFGHVLAEGLLHPSAKIEKKSKKCLSYVVNFRLFQNVAGGGSNCLVCSIEI